MKRHLEKMTHRLPYHYDYDRKKQRKKQRKMISNHLATSPNMGKDTTMDMIVAVGRQSPDVKVTFCNIFWLMLS